MTLRINEWVKVERDSSGNVVELGYIDIPFSAEIAELESPSLDDLVERYVKEVAEIYNIAPESTQTL